MINLITRNPRQVKSHLCAPRIAKRRQKEHGAPHAGPYAVHTEETYSFALIFQCAKHIPWLCLNSDVGKKDKQSYDIFGRKKSRNIQSTVWMIA